MLTLDTELEFIPEFVRNVLKIKEYREDKKSRCAYVTLEPTPLLLNSHGNIHGSYIAMLTLIAAENAARLTINEGEFMVAISHSINFLKQPDTLGDIELESCIASKSDRIIHVSTLLSCLDTDIANSTTIFVVEKL
ncbi:MAG: hotdog fold thioesterase [Ignisphaera sp.]|nr:hotdog fold thioesterase [Ignisphaera sp.]MCX8168168.1 hotdog fold thioesterase [Ignisphaera sp.]MDW8085192.1 hotdog fold domain-containing protein [Ignisphaera sp.]